jgi:3-isopropylmalate dehydrogenase
VRELTGGIYFGEKRRTGRLRERPVHVQRRGNQRVTRRRSPRQGRRKRIVSFDKANVLETSRCGDDSRVGAGAEFPDIELEHMLVDSAAMHLIRKPSSFVGSSRRTCSATF